jgi:hypothetical protein
MVRLVAASVLAVAVCTAVCLAEEVKGTVKKVEKGKITVTVEGKDTTYIVQKDARVVNSTVTKLKNGKEREKVSDISGGLTAVKVGATVSLKLEKEIIGEAEKDVVTQVKVTAGESKK